MDREKQLWYVKVSGSVAKQDLSTGKMLAHLNWFRPVLGILHRGESENFIFIYSIKRPAVYLDFGVLYAA